MCTFAPALLCVVQNLFLCCAQNTHTAFVEKHCGFEIHTPSCTCSNATCVSMRIVVVFFIFYDLGRRRRGSLSTMTPHQCWCVCGLKNRRATAEEEGTSPSSHGKLPFERRSSLLNYIHNTTTRLKRRDDKNSKKKNTNRPAQPKDLSHFPPFFYFLSTEGTTKNRRTQTGKVTLKRREKEPPQNYSLSNLLLKLHPVAHTPSSLSPNLLRLQRTCRAFRLPSSSLTTSLSITDTARPR